MKKVLLLTVALLYGMLLQAQGVYQLWGMTQIGGNQGSGVIFNTDAVGNNFLLGYQFNNSPPGCHPTGELIEYNGKFYGLTTKGGRDDVGVIFNWDPVTNVYRRKMDFYAPNGSSPSGGLTLLGEKFYGMTVHGGYNGTGVIFEWDPLLNIYTKKIDFKGINGSGPLGNLTVFDGKLYGMTKDGGSNNAGVIFEWNPSTNVYSKKIDFDSLKGSSPQGNLTLFAGKFYGMTSFGGDKNAGVIFEWNPITNVCTKKIDFDNFNGKIPCGNLALYDNKFYGMTSHGGSNDAGVIFEWDPATNVYTKKVDFDHTNGNFPEGSLTLSGGKFYGGTSDGGSYGYGVLFEWDPISNVYVKKIDNGPSINGVGSINRSLTLCNRKFYGVTYVGGGNGVGVIFEWDPSTNVCTKKFDFTVGNSGNGDGAIPLGLTMSGGKLYGMTSEGDAIFEWDPVFHDYTKKFTFNGINGRYPSSNLTLSNGKFYGMTYWGGAIGFGVIFEWDPSSNVYIKKIDFDDTNGSGAMGSLTQRRGKLYGITSHGGNNGLGVIFEWDPLTNVYVKKIDFDSANGSYPEGRLTLIGDKFYGTTRLGGNYNAGVIFEWNPATNEYTKKVDFDTPFGSNPASLTSFKGKLYGVISAGGDYGAGVIFEWDPATNVYTQKFHFDGNYNGISLVNLTLSGEKFYGIAGGGKNHYGAIFEWNPSTNEFKIKTDFNALVGPVRSIYNNELTLAPAPVSNGLPGTCTTFPFITINNSNNNQWVSITDTLGNAVAEIKANGNNLGVVTASMFINNAAVRQDGSKKLYLDRNITLTPQVQPTTPVDIRLYIKGAEYLALKNAVNSNGQPPGIDSINDVSIYKVGSSCLAAVSTLTNPVVTTAAAWEADYVFSASISSFSSFYFAEKTVCTAPVITQVCASPSALWPPNHRMKNVTVNYKVCGNCGPVSTWLTVTSDEPVNGTCRGDKSPDWIITDNHHLQLRAERAGRGNGRVYTITIHAKNMAGNISTQKTKVVVPHHFSSHHSKDWNNEEGYMDANGDYFDKTFDCKVMPNPANQYFNLQIESASDEKIEVNLLDMSGRLISKINTTKDKTTRFGEELKPGVYMVEIIQGEQQKTIKVIKQ